MNEERRGDTVVSPEEHDALEELSDYLDVLSNPARLKILKLLERRPRDVRGLSHELGTSYENTKKHLDRLMSIGLVRKEAGLGRSTSRGEHPVWEYSLVPGALEGIVRSLALFGNMSLGTSYRMLNERLGEVRGKFTAEFGEAPAIIVLGGEMDRKVLFIRGERARLGRRDPGFKEEQEERVELADSYRAVSRVSRPHAWVFSRAGDWFIEDGGSLGGTYLNASRVTKGSPVRLEDGAIVELSKGAEGARLLFVLPRKGRAVADEAQSGGERDTR